MSRNRVKCKASLVLKPLVLATAMAFSSAMCCAASLSKVVTSHADESNAPRYGRDSVYAFTRDAQPSRTASTQQLAQSDSEFKAYNAHASERSAVARREQVAAAPRERARGRTAVEGEVESTQSPGSEIRVDRDPPNPSNQEHPSRPDAVIEVSTDASGGTPVPPALVLSRSGKVARPLSQTLCEVPATDTSADLAEAGSGVDSEGHGPATRVVRFVDADRGEGDDVSAPLVRALPSPEPLPAQDENPSSLDEEFGTPLPGAVGDTLQPTHMIDTEEADPEMMALIPIYALAENNESHAVGEPPEAALQPLSEGEITVTVVDAAFPSTSIQASKRVR